MIKYVTKGNSSPSGKRRIYFSAHPSDRSLYLDIISSDILSVCDAALWYDDGEGAPTEAEVRENITGMNLIVIPITERYLCGCYAFNVELPIARQLRIPILPILMESGLTDEFNKKFGSLQYLDRTSGDVSALSYEKKLSDFLNNVGVSDETVNRIRDEFDARIFLSYRKKDRALARRLMKLIHKNDFCRDVAIWYDEYLTPGEDFNKEIADALEDCDLFALAVTPNLVNEPNYVMEHEFPMAMNLEKPIVPAELEETNRTELEKHYEHIPEPISASDETALSQRLRELLAGVTKESNDDSPEHLYYVGLAYLSGIEVEVDYEMALELLTRSAEGGWLGAMSRLSNMYFVGEGVEKSTSKALEWRTRLCSCYEERLSKDELDANGILDMFFAYLRMCEILLTTECNERDERIFARTVEIAYLVYECKSPDQGEYAIAEAYMAWGRMLDNFGEPFRALEKLKEAIDAAGRSWDPAEDRDIFGLMVEGYREMSKIYIDLGEYDDAESCVLRALDLIKQCKDEDPELDVDAATARMLSNAASIASFRKKWSDAVRLYGQVVYHYERLREKNDPMAYLEELFYAYHSLVTCCGRRRKYRETASAALRGAERLIAIAKERDTLLAEYMTVNHKIKVAYSSLYVGGFRRAERLLAEATEEAEALRGKYTDASVDRLHALANEVYVTLYTLTFRIPKADEYLAVDLEKNTEKVTRLGTTEAYMDLAESFGRIRETMDGSNRREWRGLEDRARKKNLELTHDEEEEYIERYIRTEEKRDDVIGYSVLTGIVILLTVALYIFGTAASVAIRIPFIILSLVFVGMLIDVIVSYAAWRKGLNKDYDPYTEIKRISSGISRLKKLSVILSLATLVLIIALLPLRGLIASAVPEYESILSVLFGGCIGSVFLVNMIIFRHDMDRSFAYKRIARVMSE